MVRMSTFEKEEYQRVIESIKKSEQELLAHNKLYSGKVFTKSKRQRLLKEFTEKNRKRILEEIQTLIEEKRSLEMEKVPLHTKFTIDELKEFVWEGFKIGYTFRGRRVRSSVYSSDLEVNFPKYKIIDTPYYIVEEWLYGFSVVNNKGKIIANLTDFLYPEGVPKEIPQENIPPISPSSKRYHREVSKPPVKQSTFICWACDEPLPISQRRVDGTCGECL
jgi:hypothetical protein